MSRPGKKVLCLPHDALRDLGGRLYLGGAVDATLTLFETDDLAVRIQHIAAYPDGFSFVVAVFGEPYHELVDVAETLDFNPHRRGRRSPKHLHVLVELPDGTVLVSMHGGHHYTEAYLQRTREDGSDEHYEAELVAPVLPAEGPVTFVFEWVARGIDGARATLDGGLLAAAASRAQPLFEVADLP